MKPEIIDADEANTRNSEEDHDDTKAYQEERETEQRESDQLPSEGYSDY